VNDARCEEYHELVSAFVDERLDGPDLLRLETHLEACGGCRTFERELRHFKELLPAVEAFRTLRRPPAGFAALVAARAVREQGALTVPFPAARARGRWVGMVAAAAAAALFFAWSWQRLLPVGSPEQKFAARSFSPGVEVAEAGSMDTWMREHAMLARESTLLGHAEEAEFASFNAGAVAGR